MEGSPFSKVEFETFCHNMYLFIYLFILMLRKYDLTQDGGISISGCLYL